MILLLLLFFLFEGGGGLAFGFVSLCVCGWGHSFELFFVKSRLDYDTEKCPNRN